MGLAACRREGEMCLSLCYLPSLLTLPFPKRYSSLPVLHPTPHLDEELLFEAAILGELAEGLELHHLWKFTADWP